MRRILLITALVVLSLMLFAGLGLIGFFYTPPGRHLIASLIEPRLGAALGGEASIGKLHGLLPDKIILEDIDLAGEQGDWLRIDRIEMNWTAFALLEKQIKVRSLDIEGVHLLAAPPQKPQPKKKTTFTLPSLPSSLPDVAVKSLTITNVDVAKGVFGPALKLDASGRLVMHGRMLSLDFNASSDNDTDTINASIDLDPKTNHGAVNIIVASSADGFLSSVANLGGKLYVRAVGDAPLADFNMQFEAEAGDFGSANLTLGGNLLKPGEGMIAAQGDITLGAKMASIADTLGKRLQIDLALSQPEEITRLDVNKFESAAGNLTGALKWDSGKKGVQSLSGDLAADFAQGFHSDIQDRLGENAHLTFTLTEEGKRYAIDARLDTPEAGLTIENGHTDLKNALSGLASLSLKASDSLPAPFQKGLEAQASVDLQTSGVSTLQELHMETPDGLSFDGEARFDASKNALALGGGVVIPPAALKSLTTNVSLEKPAHAQISASGTLNHLSGEIDLETPVISASGGTIPPSTATIQFSRTDAGLTADVKGRAKNAPGQIKSRIVIAGNQISAPSVSLTGTNFSLNGSASYDSGQQAAKIDLSYDGEDGAEPWPGIEASGSLALKGTLNRRNGANDLTLTANNLIFSDIKAGNLKAHASGPPSKVRIEASGENLDLPAVGSVDTLQLAGVADLGEPITVRLTKFDALASGEKIKLTKPTTIILKNGVEIRGFESSAPGRWRLTPRSRRIGGRRTYPD